jgi:mycofactocin precursor
MGKKEKDVKEILEHKKEAENNDSQTLAPPILEEITIEELAVDGICGIY